MTIKNKTSQTTKPAIAVEPVLATRAIYAKENWKLIQETLLELTKQRTIDMNHYGANCYAPITLDDAIDCCYSQYVSLHGC